MPVFVYIHIYIYIYHQNKVIAIHCQNILKILNLKE